ncbi:hypothetical protein M8C21_021218, partial [Ambrosia artemisiifolia]
KTTILLQRSARQARWPSPYLDAFGEEDIGMHRGRPLYLNEERYAALSHMGMLSDRKEDFTVWFQPGMLMFRISGEDYSGFDLFCFLFFYCLDLIRLLMKMWVEYVGT